MSVLPLSQFLKRFDEAPALPAPEPELEMPFGGDDFAFDAESVAEPEPAPPSEREEGIQEGRAAAEAEFNEKIEQVRAEFAAQLETERHAWLDTIATNLSQQLEASLAEMAEAAGRSLATILEPFVAEGVRRRAVDEVIGHVGRLMETDGHALLRVSGPTDLIERVRTAFPARMRAVEFVTTEAPDVTCVARDTIIETRLRDWADILSPPEGHA